MSTTVSGGVYRRLADGGIGSKISGVKLTFLKEDRSSTHTATSDAAGRYSVTLPAARYYLQATHADFEDYSSAPGFLVATGVTQTCNFFLRAPRITTVFVVRHGEKLHPNSNDPAEPLSDVGRTRANKLRDVLFRAGITRIHSTNFVRTKDTVRPLAEALGIPIETYDTPATVAARVLSESPGDVSLVVAHANTVDDVISAVGPPVSFSLLNDADFDNLFVASRAGPSKRVVNLQYGFETTATISGGTTGNGHTVLLVGAEGVGAEPARLRHAAARAQVAAIYARSGMTAMVTPLATSLSLAVSTYDSTSVLSVVADVLAQHANHTVVVSGTRADLRAIIQLLGGSMVILYTNDVHHLVVLTRFAAGSVRAIPTLI